MSAPVIVRQRASVCEPAAAAPAPTRTLTLAPSVPSTSTSPQRVRVLIVDDETSIRDSCASVLRNDGFDVVTCSRGQEAVDLLGKRRIDVVLADVCLAHCDGFTVLRAAQAADADTLVILMTGRPSVESSVEALRLGAWDYLPKPFSATQLQVLIGRAAHSIRATRDAGAAVATNGELSGESRLLGNARAFRAMMQLASRVAATDASVFITGDSGAGKEMVARFIHERSQRAGRPFVAVNCAALPEQLLESEMFGHRKGAFTDAVRDKPGLMETANGGTLFLDELLEMAKPIQAKLLRAVQDGVVRRVGSENDDTVVNVRFIAATNQSPEDAVADGTLREDLFYRLRVVPIHVPALRERREDIGLLANHFLQNYWTRHRGKVSAPQLSPAALDVLERHPWHGNVRELQNVIEHTVVVARPGAVIDASDLAMNEVTPRPSRRAAQVPGFTPSDDEGYHPARDRVIGLFERDYVTWLVEKAGGNMSRAARIAGIDRATLYRLIERHDLQRSPNAMRLVERHPVGAVAAPTSAVPAGVSGAA